MKKKYMLHPGYVISKNDGEMHFIDADHLRKLYGVRADQCVKCEFHGQELDKNYIHLFPRHHGDYTIEEEI